VRRCIVGCDYGTVSLEQIGIILAISANAVKEEGNVDALQKLPRIKVVVCNVPDLLSRAV
jgi:hypothetical protein